MSLPSAHLTRLEHDLRAHEERVEHLRGQIARLSDESAAHETIIALGRNERILEALGEIYEHLAATTNVQDVDAGEFLRSRNVELPAGARAEWDGSAERPALSVRLRVGEWEFSCVWDASEGFSLRQHQTPPPDQP